jgi:hypothetical protein
LSEIESLSNGDSIFDPNDTTAVQLNQQKNHDDIEMPKRVSSHAKPTNPMSTNNNQPMSTTNTNQHQPTPTTNHQLHPTTFLH